MSSQHESFELAGLGRVSDRDVVNYHRHLPPLLPAEQFPFFLYAWRRLSSFHG